MLEIYRSFAPRLFFTDLLATLPPVRTKVVRHPSIAVTRSSRPFRNTPDRQFASRHIIPECYREDLRWKHVIRLDAGFVGILVLELW